MIERPRQVAIDSARFFHHGRSAPVSTSSASNSACTPLEPSHTNTTAAVMLTVPPFQLDTLTSSLWMSSRAGAGSDLNSGLTRSQCAEEIRAAASPATAARGISDRNSQNAVCDARPNVRVRSRQT
jgi:hypothetical protein